MGVKIRQSLKRLFTLPWSCEGRRVRIERLMRVTGEERDICAAIVYVRDAPRGFLSEGEWEDFDRIKNRLVKGEITMPADRRCCK